MSTEENLAFAGRLKLALTRSPRPIESSAELAVQFNLRHGGMPVTQQAVHKWLAGKARPTPDKIATLARWLGVSEHWLRFGMAVEAGAPRHASVEEPRVLAYAGRAPGVDEQELLVAIGRLRPHQRRLILELVSQLLLEREGRA